MIINEQALSCPTDPTNLSKCHINVGCENFNWDQVFLIKLKGQDNYIRVPLAAFAVQSDSDGAYGQGNCELYVQYIDTDDESTIVLGSMILA